MITIKYKGEVVDPKDIEITWVEYNCYSKDLDNFYYLDTFILNN